MKLLLFATFATLFLVGHGSNGAAVGQKAHSAGTMKDVTGTWKGVSVVRGIRLPMVLRFKQDTKGAYTGTFESPDQHSGQVVMDQVTFKRGRVHFNVNAIQFAFDGSLSANGKRLNGTWKQRGISMAITLTKDAKAAAANRHPAGRNAHSAAPKKDVTGVWKGVAEVGGARLTMVLRFHRESDGTYTGTFESPDQHSGQVAMDQVTCKDGHIHFDVNAIQFTFDGTVSAGGKSINGTWKQRDVARPITLTKE